MAVSLLIKLGKNVDWTIDFVPMCSVLNFLLPLQRGGISKLPKKHFFALIFTIKIDFKIDFKVLQLHNGLR
jgi:hypothetical protein